jgi:hypothetical protein
MPPFDQHCGSVVTTPRPQPSPPFAGSAGTHVRTGRQCLAVDLGTSTVRPWKPRASAVISELAVLCRRSDGRQVAGRAALAARTGGSTATWPVRDGVVRDYFTCVHLLRLLTADLTLPPHTMYPVLVGVPATATSRQRNLLVASVRRAVGGRVSSVEEPLAAASACRPGPSETDLVVADIWAGRIEVARIRGRNVAADARRLCSSPRPSGQAASAAAHRLRSGDSRRRRPAGLADWPAAVAARRLTGLPSPRHAVIFSGVLMDVESAPYPASGPATPSPQPPAAGAGSSLTMPAAVAN